MDTLADVLQPLLRALAPAARRLRRWPWADGAAALEAARVARDPDEWTAFRVVLGLLAGGAAAILFENAWAGVAGLWGGWALPALWLREQRRAWERAFLKPLPDVLDLMGSCVAGGASWESAAASVAEHTPRRHPVKEELERILYELKIGRSRREAFAASGRRVALPGWSALLASVLQAERLGTSIVETLTVQVTELRLARRQALERQALEAPIKLLFPLTLFIFPTTFVVLFGPLFLRRGAP